MCMEILLSAQNLSTEDPSNSWLFSLEETADLDGASQ